jgi:hypothetical protein
MKTFWVEMTNNEYMDHCHRVVKVKACTVHGAIRRAFKKNPYITGTRCDFVYQVLVDVKGCDCR